MHLCFIESLLFFCCFSRWDIHSVSASLIPNGELMPFLAQCSRFTLRCRGSTARIGTSLRRPDSLSACFIYSRRYWHGSWVALRQRLWRSCAALRGRSPFVLPPSRL